MPVAKKPKEVASLTPKTTTEEQKVKKNSLRYQKVQSRKNLEEEKRRMNGEPVTFFLLGDRKPPNTLFKAESIVFIPYDWNRDKTLKNYIESNNLLEKDSNGEYITGDAHIRYIHGERSIYKENQSEGKVIKNPIPFTSGSLVLNSKRDALLIKFLRLSNLNQSNPLRDMGVAPEFFEYSPVAKAQEEINRANVINKAYEAVFNAEPEELYAIANILNVDLVSEDTIKSGILSRILKTPEYILGLFDDPYLSAKNDILAAEKLDIISHDKRRVFFVNGKRTIVTVPSGKDWLDFFSEWVTLEEEGQEVLEVINRALDR